MDYISKDEAINLLEHNDKVFHYADRDKENIVYDTINTLCRVLIEMKSASVQPLSVVAEHIKNRLYETALNTNGTESDTIAAMAERIGFWIGELNGGEHNDT